MKRHSRPYGCTYLSCNKTFGSKNDWKRHENSQHFQHETWRCLEENPEGRACAKVAYSRQTFLDHLKREHSISDVDAIKTKVDAYHIGRNYQARFWCGFCRRTIDLEKKNLEAWAERIDHIDDHFMGRNGFLKQGIEYWVPINRNEPKGYAPDDSDPSAGQETLDTCPASPASGFSNESSGMAGESSASTNITEDHKRGIKRGPNSVDGRPAKRPLAE
jgi:hypothetical protein